MRMIPPANLPFPLLSINTTAVGTDADTDEKTLMSFPLPANTLLRDGQGIRIKAWGRTGANGNTKTVRIRLGGLVAGTILFTLTGAFNDKDWSVEAITYRTGVGSQDMISEGKSSETATIVTFRNGSVDETTELEVVISGQNGTGAANDIICDGLSVELINAV